METVGNAVDAPGFRLRLERTDEERVAFAAHVERRFRVSKDGKLERHRAHRVDRFRDEVVMLEGHDGQIDTHQAADARGPTDRPR